MLKHRYMYRPDIDGLRGVAVLLVVIFHAFPQVLPGGFIGVDVFFVISGFLITGIIISASKRGEFSFSDFYWRRVRRILPALLLVLFSTLLIGGFFLVPSQYEKLAWHTISSLAFLQNFNLLSESGYFDSASYSKPLLHIWSLAVEEQFYIVWPLLVALILLLKRSTLLFLLGVMVFLGSFTFCWYLTNLNIDKAYFLPFSRFWEIMAGAVIAIYQSNLEHNRQYLSFIFQRALSAFGVFLIIASAFLINNEMSFPGWVASIPVLGACLVVAFGAHCKTSFLLCRSWIVGVGLISYPLYLWHWPIISFLHIHFQNQPSLYWLASAVMLSLLLAYMTYRWVETPIRFGKLIFWKPLVLGATAIVFLLSVLVYADHGVPERFPFPERYYSNFKYDFSTDARYPACWLEHERKPELYKPECYAGLVQEKIKPRLLVWGDSYAARLYPGLENVIGDDFSISQLTRNGCAPILGYNKNSKDKYCIENNDFVYSIILETQPDVVVLFANWQSNMKRPGFVDQLDETLQKLSQLKSIRIILLGPAPMWKGDLPILVFNRLRNGDSSALLRMRDELRLAPQLEERMSSLAFTHKISYFSLYNVMCNELGCMTHVADGPENITSWDTGHFTTAASEYTAELLSAQMNISVEVTE